MNIFDSHLHLPVRNKLDSLEDQRDELIKELEKNSIKGGVLIPDNIEISQIGNLKQCVELFNDVPSVFLLGTVNILEDDLDKKVGELDAYFKSKKVVGLKIFPGHDKHLPNDSRLEPFINLCLRYNKPLVIHTGENSGDSECSKYNDPKYIVEISDKYSGLKIVISHLFWPKVEYCVELTKGYANISYDTSALADDEVVAVTGEEKISNALEDLINKYHKKVLYGSDYGMCSVTKHIKLVKSLDISKKDKQNVFYNNSVKLFELEL